MKEQSDRDDDTLVVNIDLTRGVGAGLAGAAIAAILVGCLAWGHIPAAASAKGVSSMGGVSAALRSYYLAAVGADGSQAGAADVCADGFHFASIWEILDPSNLVYDSSLGFTLPDIGSGPPAGALGWVRTGYLDNTSATPGRGNCNGWSSANPAHYGTAVFLADDWTVTSDVHIWHAVPRDCGNSAPVWCVED
jgi:hypothetical protein